ncbi:benzoate 4-monooxygenase cytochrome P450 [Pyrenochaeta sp. MPI-SDFR-AT-0127]|nr:benzoate 4-monooxygenase cytochrome P450 [Pyrenochaeta sp. MPI-SDFR-AT-0127]
MMLASNSKAFLALLFLPVLLVGYAITRICYNLFWHPLRKFPGPLLARATIITYQWKSLQGFSHKWLQHLHEKYGPVVRCSPNELSIIEPAVWKDIYGHRATSFVKEPEFYGEDAYGSPAGIIRADNFHHGLQRKLVSHAFSDKALRDQEQCLQGYVALLIERLKEASMKGAADMVEWYNFTTFDIMADLTFGESLGQLNTSTYSPWVKATFSFLKVVSIMRVCRSWPGIAMLLQALVPADVQKKRETHIAFTKDRVNERMARKTDRPDIWTLITKYDEGKGLEPGELHNNGLTFMVAGTETTATLLSGLTYLLLKNPIKLNRLTTEVRTAFSSFDDMTMSKLSQLTYLNACLNEGLRMYPPVPAGLPRRTPDSGAMVCGHWVAGGTIIQCPMYAAFHSSKNWTEPETFAPERFLPENEKQYSHDRKDVFNPFSYGPRNCLGKNLAYHEMRLILASVLLHFDLKLSDPTDQWLDQEVHILWEKGPLFVTLTRVK